MMVLSDKLIEKYARKMFNAAYPETQWQYLPTMPQARKQDRFLREAKVLLLELLADDDVRNLFMIKPKKSS